ncbi:MAG: T9SS type A sorting domain-containing protein [Bacteroidales bacterium]|nr:T9SS type A sorting domain-containing protein [Bacteroidales bacterium]
MKKFFTLALATIILATQQTFAVPLMQENNATPLAVQTASEQTFVVVEVLSSVTCGYCPPARAALATMAQNQEEFPYLIPLLWQYGGNQSPNLIERWSFYDNLSTPTARFGGSIVDVGAGANILQRYTGHYNTVAQRQPPMKITVDYEIINNQIRVISDVELISNITTTNNRIFFVLTYDWGTEQPGNYDASVVAFNNQAFGLTTSGQSDTFDHTFTLNPAWDLSKIRVVSFVQTTAGDLAIHQAATKSVSGLPPPPAPHNVVAEDNTTHVTLTWDEPNAVPRHLWTMPTSPPELQGYRIWRLLDGQQNNSNAWTLIANHATSTYFMDTMWVTVAPGVYKYAVSAIYTDDVLSEPAFSNTVTAETTSISLLEQDAVLSVFPNPVLDGKLVVEIPENTRSAVIRVYDFSGRLVLTHAIDCPKTEINISHLPNGVYVVRVGQNTARIIKQ